MRVTSRIGLAGAALAAMAVVGLAGQSAAAADDGDGVIRGVVRSGAGGEAGVWVIAETADLETTFRKIVVTGDDGRFLVPDLPDAAYEVWVRGYGLVDSDKHAARPGDELTLEVAAAATPQEAARIYPANYWYSLLEVPAEDEFPGTGPRGNGIGRGMRHQAEWVDRLKDGCQLCHQMGNMATREMPMIDVDDFDSTVAAWDHRVQVGRSGPSMNSGLNRMGRERALQLFADWTDRIAAGEVPPEPPRPQGVERNVVMTMWGWGDPIAMVHDEIATDKRNPHLYPNAPIYGVGGAGLTITDPVTHRSVRLDMTTRDPMPERGDSYAGTTAQIPSPYWGDERSTARGHSAHNPMLDADGRLWITQRIRTSDNPAWCKEGSDHPSASHFPIERSQRQLSYWDVEAEEFVHVDTCYMTHHLQFAEDENDTLWLSGSTDVVGWLNTKLYDETGDEQSAQGWCPTIVDTSGDGRIGEYTEPGEPQDPTKDMRLDGFAYGIIPNPVDGSIWIARRLPGTGEHRPPRPWRQPARELHRRGLRAAVRESRRRSEPVGARRPRDRRRPQRRPLDGARRKRPPGELRPQQVPGAERADRDRSALPRGVDAVPDAGPADERRHRGRERRLPLLQLGGPVQYVGAGRQRPHRERHGVGRPAGAAARQRRVGHAARAVSPRLLHARPRRAHR